MNMPTHQKIMSLPQLQTQRKTWKERQELVVFTNGCFDLVHLGHVDYLEKARNKGDRLVVGVNTDTSVSRLKGLERPVQDEYARARILAAFEFVDAVILFEEDTPLSLIQAVQPDILTKGSDYTVETIVGADFVLKGGGKVETLDLVEGYSTSQIIERVKKSEGLTKA